jgi:pimeloyl-ACP methyl ester carboxylesterase
MRRFLIVVLTLLVVMAAALAAIYHHFDPERTELTDAVRAFAPSGGSYVALTDGTTHYQIAGPADAQTVVLVHGFSVPYYIWDPMFDGLVRAGFRVLRYDTYGRGYSDRPDVRYDADLFDRQLLNLLDALQIKSPVDIAGLSMGGPVTVIFAVRHPERVRSILLFDPAVRGGKTPLAFRLPVVGEFYMDVFEMPHAARDQMGDLAHPERFPDWPERYKPQMRIKGFRRALLSTVRYYMPRDLTADFTAYGRRGKPALLVWGTEDKTLPFPEMSAIARAAIPQAEFHAIDDAGHIPYMEKPEQVIPIAIDFLRRQGAATASAAADHTPEK